MRYSKQRELVMQQVEALQDHPTAEEIYEMRSNSVRG